MFKLNVAFGKAANLCTKRKTTSESAKSSSGQQQATNYVPQPSQGLQAAPHPFQCSQATSGYPQDMEAHGDSSRLKGKMVGITQELYIRILYYHYQGVRILFCSGAYNP